MYKPIVLSLFDGISCGRIVLDKLGVKPYAYYASEIDKYAIKVSKANYPDIKHLGDVENWREWDIPWEEVDLLLAGFPCQAWSFSGKQKGLDDPRGELALTLSDIFNFLKEKNPDIKFLFENVKMKQSNLRFMNKLFGTEAIFINSRVVSAQNRQRYYWCNWDISEPEEREIYLEDILEEDAVGCVLKDHGKFKWRKGKSTCIDANYWKGVDNHAQRTMVVFQRPRGFNNGGFKALDGKTPTLSSSSWEQNNFLCDLTKEMIRKFFPVECERLQGVPDGYTAYGKIYKNYEFYGEDKRCLQYVKSRDVISQSQVRKVCCAINTNLDLLEEVQQNSEENWLIKPKNVKLMAVKETNRPLKVSVLNTIKDGNEKIVKTIKNVKFVITRSEMDGESYVYAMRCLNQGMVILKESIKIQKENYYPTVIKGHDTINQRMVGGFIKKLLKRFLVENSKKEKLYIILTLINLIIVKSIYMSVKATQTTYVCIDSLSQLQENLLEMELSSLKMETIDEISNTRRYKMLGNAWQCLAM